MRARSIESAYPLLRSCAGWGVTWQAARVEGEWQFRPTLPEMDEENAVALRAWMEMKRVGLGLELRTLMAHNDKAPAVTGAEPKHNQGLMEMIMHRTDANGKG